MSLKRKIFSFITLIFAIIALTTFVSAQDSATKETPQPPMKEGKSRNHGFSEGRHGKRGMRGDRGGDRHLLRMLRGLELTDAQQTQIKTLMETNRATDQPLREEAHALHMKKRDGSVTESEMARLDQLKTDMKASSEQIRLTIIGLLTPAQNSKLEQMKVEREQRMQERQQRRQERKQQKQSAPADKPLN